MFMHFQTSRLSTPDISPVHVSSQTNTLPTMKVLSTGTALALLANQAAAHYIWTSLTIGGTTGTGAAGGIRPNSNYNSPVIGKWAALVRWSKGMTDPSLTQTLPPTTSAATKVASPALGLPFARSRLASSSPSRRTLLSTTRAPWPSTSPRPTATSPPTRVATAGPRSLRSALPSTVAAPPGTWLVSEPWSSVETRTNL